MIGGFKMSDNSWHILERTVDGMSRDLARDVGMVWRFCRNRAARARQLREAREADRLARRQMEISERLQQEQRRQWLEMVQRQNIRGHAGNATPEEARQALRGRGGRPNPLDDRWF
jgi:hypothetical protein